MHIEERRLDERILFALHLAVEQEDLEVAELLARALEACLTRFGGPDKVDHRQFPAEADVLLDRLFDLRQRRLANG